MLSIQVRRNVEAPFWTNKVADFGIFIQTKEGLLLQVALRETIREAVSVARWVQRAHVNPKIQKHLHPRWHLPAGVPILIEERPANT